MPVIVTRHLHNFRMYAYGICALFCVLCIIVTYLNTAGYNKHTYFDFWMSMIAAFAADILVVEWAYVGLVWLYRWMVGELKETPIEVHPFEGEERLREY